MRFQIGLLLFPNLTQLDMTGPYEVFTKFPDSDVHLVWKSLEPVTAGGGMALLPSMTFADCPQFDLICVPGGAGMNALLKRCGDARLRAPPGGGGALRHLRVHGIPGAGRGGTLAKASARLRTGCRTRCSRPSVVRP